ARNPQGGRQSRVMLTGDQLFEMALDEVPDPEARIEKVFAWTMDRAQSATKGAFALVALLLAALVPVFLAPPKSGKGLAVTLTTIAAGLSFLIGIGLYIRQQRVASAYVASLRLYRRLLPIADALRPWVRE